jgi:hypothetical protein
VVVDAAGRAADAVETVAVIAAAGLVTKRFARIFQSKLPLSGRARSA